MPFLTKPIFATFDRALTIDEKVLGPKLPVTSATLNNLAGML
jgi:hypothetical protein